MKNPLPLLALALIGSPLAAEVPATLLLPSTGIEAAVMNEPLAAAVDAEGTLALTSPGRRNLFVSPGGDFRQTDAPMILFPAGDEFVFSAKVAAPLTHVYDVAALVVYVDAENWAKLCYENSVEMKATLVSVVNRGLSDDCNGPETEAGYIYYAILRRGAEFAFHWSADGKTWHLLRHFRLESAAPVRIGFAVHGVDEDPLTGTFSEIHYVGAVKEGLRYYRPEER